MSNKANDQKRTATPNKQVITLLILTVTLVLLTLILAGGQAGLIAPVVMIILIVLILSITGHPELLPDTFTAILSEIRRAVTSRRS